MPSHWHHTTAANRGRQTRSISASCLTHRPLGAANCVELSACTAATDARDCGLCGLIAWLESFVRRLAFTQRSYPNRAFDTHDTNRRSSTALRRTGPLVKAREHVR